MSTSIAELEASYEQFTNNSNDIATGIASTMEDLDLSEIKSTIAEAVMQMEKISAPSEPSKLARIPFLGSYFKKAQEKIDEESLHNGSMQAVVDRLFNSLTAKKDNILVVMDTMFALQERLREEAIGLQEKEQAAEEIIEMANGSGPSAFRAKNLLVQVKQSLIKTKDRIQVIEGTIRSAEASALRISSLLPSLRGELLTELAISGGLKELKEFREIFDATVDVIEEMNDSNNKNMKKVMLDVVDLAISTPTNLARLENINKERVDFQKQLKTKMQVATVKRDEAITVLTNIRNNQNLLSFEAPDEK